MMVPKRLKEAREAAGLSQERLAQLVDIDTVNSRSRISNYESGRFTPPFNFIQRVAKVLDYPEGYFYTSDDDFAEIILMTYRNRENPAFNPYFQTLVEIKEQVEKLYERLKSIG